MSMFSFGSIYRFIRSREAVKQRIMSQVLSDYNRSKSTFQLCKSKWHLNYSYVTMFFL